MSIAASSPLLVYDLYDDQLARGIDFHPHCPRTSRGALPRSDVSGLLTSFERDRRPQSHQNDIALPVDLFIEIEDD